jgi:hypothetical protein
MAHGEQGPLDRERRDLSDDKERNKILEEVLRDQARREVLRDVAYRRPSASLRRRIATGVLAAIALAMWVVPVRWLRADIPFPLSPVQEDAGIRVAAFLQAQQIEVFRQETGRLPDILRETGEAVPGVEYRRIDARTYELTAMTERDTVRWLNSDSIPALLGDSAAARLRTVMR